MALSHFGRHDEARRVLNSILQESDDPGTQASALIGIAQFQGGDAGWQTAEQALQLSPVDSLSFWSEPVALTILGEIALGAGRYDQAMEMVEQSRDLCHRFGWLVGEAVASDDIASILILQGRYDEAADVIESAWPVVRSILGPNHVTSWNHLRAAEMSRLRGDLELADTYAQQADEEAKRNELPAHEIRASVQYALNSQDRGQLDEAARMLNEAAKKAEELGGLDRIIREIRVAQAGVAVREVEPERASELLREVLREFDRVPRHILVNTVDLAAITLTQLGRTKPAARLLGAVDNDREGLGLVIPPPDIPVREQTVEKLRSALGEDWEEELHAGRGMTLDEAVDLALAEPDR